MLPPETTYIDASITAEGLEDAARQRSIAVPEGYTNVGVLASDAGVWLIVTADGLPAMGLVRGVGGDLVWARAFKSATPTQ